MENSAPVDRISNLPDELLCHILSFLSTKLAFTTTVLSKRWTPLIKLLTTLSFDEESLGNKKDFPHIVETVILSTELIKTIYLNCHSKHSNRFNLWIKTAKLHPLENLQLVGTFDFNMITLWPSIFIFPTLVVLKLTKLKVVDDISVDLPSLKTLHLILVYFKNKDNFKKLLNGCPILEDLQTHIYYMEQGDDVRLKTLSKLMRANIVTYERIGFKDEIEFATYILKNAPLLRVMKITVPLPSLSCWNALEELKSCPRISPKCELSFSFNFT